MGDDQFVPGISNDKSPSETGFGESWQVSNYLDADDVRHTGTYDSCVEFIRDLRLADRDERVTISGPRPEGLTLAGVLASLYRSEINACVESEWDAGWNVRVGGGAYGGWLAETTIESPPWIPDASEEVRQAAMNERLLDIAAWLHGKAIELYPDSLYALGAVVPSE